MPRTFPTQPDRIAKGTTATGNVPASPSFRKHGDQPNRIKNK